MNETPTIPISEEWLLSSGFHVIENADRQKIKTFRRCLGRDVIGDRFMLATEDLCIDVSACSSVDRGWFVWVTKCHSANREASAWVHVRHMQFSVELVLLYEALSGRKFLPVQNSWDALGEPLFEYVGA